MDEDESGREWSSGLHSGEQLACVVVCWVRGSVTTGSLMGTEESVRSSSRQRRRRHTDGLSWSVEGHGDMVGWGGIDTHTLNRHSRVHTQGVEAQLKWEDGVQEEVKAASALWTSGML